MGKYEIVNQWYLQTGDVLCYSKSHWISRMIQILTRSKYNHVGIVERINNRIYVYEAIDIGFVRRPLCQSIEKDCIEVIIKRPNFVYSKKELISELDKLLGRPYDTASIFYQIKHQLFGGWKGSKNTKKLYCSEAVAYVYNVLTGLFKDWYKTSPDDFSENELNFYQAKELDLKSIE